MKSRFPGFEKCLMMMRKRDPRTQEDGFHLLLPHASEHLHELIEEYHRETNLGLRCWLLELIGSTRSPAALQCLASELRGSHEQIRTWAIRGLKNLDTSEARKLLWDARSLTFESQEATRQFRIQLASSD